jgi:pimeloyl-ACP methyl ester carboxylesterase
MVTVRGIEYAAGDQHHTQAFDFITIERTRLRYLDRGSGPAVVLLHGNGSMIEDYVASGIIEHAAADYRFIAFDRPGFGHSERPRGLVWGPAEQASLLLRALAHLDVEQPIIVGHSWGALVALAMALRNPAAVAGLVLMSGYYYPARGDAMALPFPFANDVMRHAVRRMMAPNTLRRVFAPCFVPERFRRTFPLPLAMRTSQMRAVDEEAAMLHVAARALSPFYRDIDVPVSIIAGSEDRIVDTEQHSARLHRELATSTFLRVPYCGHMVHHSAPEEVAAAIDAIGQARRLRAVAHRGEASASPLRQWLHIGDGRVAA